MSDVTPEQVKQLHDDLKATWEDQKKALADQKAEIAKSGEVTAETRQLIEKQDARLNDLEVKLSRPGGSDSSKREEATEYAKAFDAYLRKGEAAGADVLKTLTRGDDTTGGFLAPDERIAEIIKGATDYTPFRNMVTVRRTSRGAVSIPKRTGQFAAVRVGEGATRSETDGWRVGRERIPVHMLHALVKVTLEDLADTEVNLESIIDEEAAEQFAVKEGAEFVSGTGNEEAEGFLTNADVATTNMGSTSVPTYGKLVDMLHSLKTPYFKNATWSINLAMLGVLRKIEDTEGNLIFNPGLAGEAPNTILGRPYELVAEMPAIASASKSIAVGDFKKAYVWVDHVEMLTQRLVEKFSDEGAIGLQFNRRSGGQVVLPEAIKVGVMSV